MDAIQATRKRMSADPQRPAYHFLPPANWMNDPVGLIHWKDRYHLFYQHNPNGAYWGDMHWGHTASLDLVHWQDLPIALAPTPGSYDQDGCWSGCAVDDGGAPTLLYTAKLGDRESVCLATSQDELVNWRKHPENPVIASPPAEMQTTGFRDPYLWKEKDVWMMAIGSGIVGKGGAVLLYRSPDLQHWRFQGLLCASEESVDNVVWECPNFFSFDGVHTLVFSDMACNCVRYLTGDYRGQRFFHRNEGRVDFSSLFYAPQVMVDQHGRRLMFGWIREDRNVEAQIEAGWSGLLSLPRLLGLSPEARLLIDPVPELESLRQETIDLTEMVGSRDGEFTIPVSGDTLEINLRVTAHAGEFAIKVRCAADLSEQTTIQYLHAAQQLEIIREESSLDTQVEKSAQRCPVALNPGEPLHLRMFLDRSVIEVFANRSACLTSRIYPTSSESQGIRICKKGQVDVESFIIHRMKASFQ